MSTLVLINATIINGTGTDPLPNGSVVVEGERIKEVIPGPPGMVPSDTIIIDCHHQTLMPGLIDAHVHVGAVEANLVEQQRRSFYSFLIIRTLKVIEETLDQGFTTVRDAGGADPGLREALQQGLIQGPRLFVAGCPLSQTGGHGDFRLPTEMRSPSEDLAGLATRICDGVDQVHLRGFCAHGFLESTRFLKHFISILTGFRLAAVREILVGVFLILLMIYRQEGVLPEEKIQQRN